MNTQYACSYSDDVDARSLMTARASYGFNENALHCKQEEEQNSDIIHFTQDEVETHGHDPTAAWAWASPPHLAPPP